MFTLTRLKGREKIYTGMHVRLHKFNKALGKCKDWKMDKLTLIKFTVKSTYGGRSHKLFLKLVIILIKNILHFAFMNYLDVCFILHILICYAKISRKYI